MGHAKDNMDVLTSEQMQIGALVVLIVIANFIIGTWNLILLNLQASSDSKFCSEYSVMDFLMSLSDIIDNVVPIAFLLYTHHKSFRITVTHDVTDPNGLDITFYDDLTSVSENVESKEAVESKPIDMTVYESNRSLTAPDVFDKQFVFAEHNSQSVIGD